MNIKNKIWTEIGELTFEYVSPFNRERKEYSYNTARMKILELSKHEDINTEPYSESGYLFGYLNGKINAKLQEVSPNYFPEYKVYKFFVEYRAWNGEDSYWLKVVFPKAFHGYATDSLEQMYSKLKERIDRGELY